MTKFGFMATIVGVGALGIVGATQAVADETRKSYEQAIKDTQIAADWLDGEFVDPNLPDVTYDGEPFQLTYATYIPEVSGIEKLMKRSLARLEAESDGKIKIRSFFGAALHPQREGFTAVRNGIADYSACFMVYEPTSFNMLHGLTLPFLFDDSVAATRTALQLYPEYFKEEYENLGVLMGRQVITTPYNAIGKTAYRKLDDWKGSKVRLSGRTQVAALKQLGGVPVDVSSAEAYTALQRGLVDSILMNDPAHLLFKHQEVSKAWTQVGLFSINLEYCTGQDFVDQMPTDLQDVYYRWLQKMSLAMSLLFYERDSRRALEAFREADLEIVQPSAAEIAKWRDAVAPVSEQWIAENESEGRPAAKMLGELRELEERYSGQKWEGIFRGIMDQPVEGMFDRKGS